MKWNFIISLVVFFSVYGTVALPMFMRLRAATALVTAPPAAAFLVALPFAVCSALAVFAVFYALQRYGFTL